MYRVDDVVMYGVFGLCRVTAIEKRNFAGKAEDYYLLRPIKADKSVYYVPMNNPAALSRIRPVCSKTEVDALIARMHDTALPWIENDGQRKEEFNRILKDADKYEVMQLVKTLYLRRQALSEKGKKLRSSDEECLTLGENMLFEEFACALSIDRDAVVDYIRQRLQ